MPTPEEHLKRLEAEFKTAVAASADKNNAAVEAAREEFKSRAAELAEQSEKALAAAEELKTQMDGLKTDLAAAKAAGTEDDARHADREFKYADRCDLAVMVNSEFKANGKAEPFERNDKGDIVADNDAFNAMTRAYKSFVRYDARHGEGLHGWLRTLDGEEMKAATYLTTADAAGGLLVPPYVRRTLNEVLRERVTMRQYARIVPIGAQNYSELFIKPEVNDGVGKFGGWVGEAVKMATTDGVELGQTDIGVGKCFARPVVTREALNDSDFNLQGIITQKAATLFAEAENRSFWRGTRKAGALGQNDNIELVAGNGVEGPIGMLSTVVDANLGGRTSAGGGIVEWAADQVDGKREFHKFLAVKSGVADKLPHGGANASAAATIDLLERLVTGDYGLRPAYRRNCKWFMNRATMSQIRRLRDEEGRYYFQPDVRSAATWQIWGYDVVEEEEMPDVAAGAYPIFFGNMHDAYTIVDRERLYLVRNPWEEQASEKIIFHHSRRLGGRPWEGYAGRFLKIAA